MPSDSWKKANARAAYGPVGPTKGAQPPKQKTHRKRRTAQRHTYVLVGRCLIERQSNMAVELTLPEGRKLWVPRSVMLNGNAKPPRGTVILLSVDKWFLLRERITPAPPTETQR